MTYTETAAGKTERLLDADDNAVWCHLVLVAGEMNRNLIRKTA